MGVGYIVTEAVCVVAVVVVLCRGDQEGAEGKQSHVRGGNDSSST